ncbi:hypothetical protein SUGI_0800640 [Cryptomeria japonica]|uniref:uncharacterized protein LOC131046370 n=1 Tax=Cryptomeria japonica TaxID=3369 RepID=UPI0024148EFD|nr:uncharacterized protein LOC131046370 [Cryptomeria japonica]GLJ39244.1 hypothetical protein SUGI_0800640 [Cryptomeria japonica]
MAGFNLQSARELQHFSHPHILKLSTWNGGAPGDQLNCKGCIKPIANGLIYSCKPCNFYLHLSCAQIPQQINHPADNHVLNLLSSPWAYSEGPCLCDACGQEMKQGFSFHCSLCRLDLHPSCANLPMKFNHPHHPEHTLALCFVPPYPDKSFICDVCKQFGRGLWHYHCSECQYDSHVTCTQITSLRERVINEFLENYMREISQRGLMGGHMPMGNPHYMGRSYSYPLRYSGFPQPSMFNNTSSFHVQQQQRPPFPSAYGNGNHSTFGRSGMENMVQNIMQGGTSNNFDFVNMINPGGGNGGGRSEDMSSILNMISQGGGGNGLDIFGNLNGLGGGNDGGLDILRNLSGLGDFSSVIGSMFGFGFF